MNNQQKEKLKDYISGLKELKNTQTPPIGAIIVDIKNKKDAVKMLKSQKIAVVMNDKKNPYKTLDFIAKNIKKGNEIALDFESGLDIKVMQALENISNGFFYTILPGKKKPEVINPINKKSKLVLLAEKKVFDDVLGGRNFVSSVCRI